eukprot:3849827-Pyramimonas_sp.AAC.1
MEVVPFVFLRAALRRLLLSLVRSHCGAAGEVQHLLSYYCPAPVHHQASRCNVSHCPKDDHTEYCMYGGAHAAAVLMC